MQDSQILTPTIGTPVYNTYGNLGFISRILPARANVFTIGAGGLQRPQADYEICFDDRLTVLSDMIVKPWLTRAAHCPSISPEEVEEKRKAALRATAAARVEQAAKSQAAADARAAFLVVAESRVPAWAKAVIVAELEKDCSDIMTDYFNATTTRTVILGFSKHTRDLFPELRSAARTFPETASLADAPDSAEHREKYSMGAGYYLKASGHYSTGWKVHKRTLYDGVKSMPSGEWLQDTPEAKAWAADQDARAQAKARERDAVGGAATAMPSGGALTVEKHAHTKHGFDMWICIMSERVERAEYDRLLAAARVAGGWYSRAWGRTPGGFAFKSEAAARTFAGQGSGDTPPATPAPDGAGPSPHATPSAAVKPGSANGAATAAKLRTLADGLQKDIDHKFSDRLTNTPKRQREAQSARLDGFRLQRTQQALRALAGCYEAGAVPADLRGVTTKAAVFDLCRSKIESSGGYYDAGRDTGQPAVDTPATRAIWALISGPSDAERAAANLRDKVEALQFANIPGYFPTPAPIIARMIAAAGIPEGGCSVLEPSAGSGAILDAIRAAEPGCELVLYELNHKLGEILRAKGYARAGEDFTESDLSRKVARVLMNPPFENSQDIAHVMRAFEHLEPGGRLVAIMSPGPFFRQDAKALAFREWFDALGGEKTDLPTGSFKESGTGVAAVMVEIRA